MLDIIRWQVLLVALAGWVNRHGAAEFSDSTRATRSNDSDRGRHFRRAIAEYVAHYHQERNHQGLGNRLVAGRR